MAASGTGGRHETTEWEDILRDKGIIPDKSEQQLAEEGLQQLVEDTVETFDPHAHKGVDELDEELEDADSEEERILLKYRESRINEVEKKENPPPRLFFIFPPDYPSSALSFLTFTEPLSRVSNLLILFLHPGANGGWTRLPSSSSFSNARMKDQHQNLRPTVFLPPSALRPASPNSSPTPLLIAPPSS
mmetsp:Transcript_13262/g.35251  ORF Transcript_13262/g.35251 Transcript_13262/m.35251 type:complete len:189 (-) Transcript_13262:539-1105(-)